MPVFEKSWEIVGNKMTKKFNFIFRKDVNSEKIKHQIKNDASFH